jgi:uncharacterized protein with GYD domain
MPRYLHQFSYSTDAVRAMTAKPQNRKRAATKLFKAAGGRIIDMYYCFGDYDGVVISEFPSNVDAAAVALTVGASGSFSKMHTTVLITVEESVEAMKKANKVAGAYSPPKG